MNVEQRITQLENEMRMLKAASTIPYDVEVAFKSRLKIGEGELATSTKAASTESRTVNEAGTSSYSVSRLMDGFVQKNLLGTTIYIPYYL